MMPENLPPKPLAVTNEPAVENSPMPARYDASLNDHSSAAFFSFQSIGVFRQDTSLPLLSRVFLIALFILIISPVPFLYAVSH